MTTHLDPHHHALNALLATLRQTGGFGTAGSLMQLHQRGDWTALHAAVTTLHGSTDVDAVRTEAHALIVALEAGPLQPDWLPPEAR